MLDSGPETVEGAGTGGSGCSECAGGVVGTVPADGLGRRQAPQPSRSAQVTAYVHGAGAMFEILSSLGLRFKRTVAFPHMSRPWAHELPGESMTGGAEIVTTLERYCRTRGAAVHTSARVSRLLRQDERVAGVVVGSYAGASPGFVSAGATRATRLSAAKQAPP
jgi:hypothetical protein